MKKVDILMIGPSLQVRGGISTTARVLLEHWPVGKYPVVYLDTLIDGSKAQKLMVAMRALLRFVYMLCVCSPYLVHIHFSSRASFWRKSLFVLLGRMLGRQIILHANGSEFHIFYRMESGPVQRKLIRWILNQADRLLVVSTQWQEFYRHLYVRNDPVVLYNPTVCPPLHLECSNKKPVILTLGRLGKRKGTYDLLKAIPLVLESCPQAEFWLGGDGDVDLIREIVKKEPWGKQVQVLGWVTGEQKEQVLRDASVFVLPSYNEGLPLAILEAMAYGLPVVSTPVGGIPEAVVDGETGFLVSPGDVETLAQRLSLLLTHPSLCYEMGMRARQRVLEKFDVHKIIQQLFTIYDELLLGK